MILLAVVLSSVAPTIATIGSLNNELAVPLTVLRADAATRTSSWRWDPAAAGLAVGVPLEVAAALATSADLSPSV